SNLGNSTDMYRLSFGGIANALSLLLLGTSPALAAIGVAGAVFLLLTFTMRRLRPPEQSYCPGRGDVAWLLAAPAALVMIQYLLLADGKPPEYARFALLPDTFLLLCA